MLSQHFNKKWFSTFTPPFPMLFHSFFNPSSLLLYYFVSPSSLLFSLPSLPLYSFYTSLLFPQSFSFNVFNAPYFFWTTKQISIFMFHIFSFELQFYFTCSTFSVSCHFRQFQHFDAFAARKCNFSSFFFMNSGETGLQKPRADRHPFVFY